MVKVLNGFCEFIELAAGTTAKTPESPSVGVHIYVRADQQLSRDATARAELDDQSFVQPGERKFVNQRLGGPDCYVTKSSVMNERQIFAVVQLHRSYACGTQPAGNAPAGTSPG